jgi:hypothetical protein
MREAAEEEPGSHLAGWLTRTLTTRLRGRRSPEEEEEEEEEEEAAEDASTTRLRAR